MLGWRGKELMFLSGLVLWLSVVCVIFRKCLKGIRVIVFMICWRVLRKRLKGIWRMFFWIWFSVFRISFCILLIGCMILWRVRGFEIRFWLELWFFVVKWICWKLDLNLRGNMVSFCIIIFSKILRVIIRRYCCICVVGMIEGFSIVDYLEVVLFVF